MYVISSDVSVKSQVIGSIIINITTETTTTTTTTITFQQPVPSIRGQMSLTLESVVDVAKAANYLVILVPPITTEQTSVTQTEKPQQVTSLTQCHKGSIFS